MHHTLPLGIGSTLNAVNVFSRNIYKVCVTRGIQRWA